MTDYLEEGPGQGEALLQALEAMVLWIPVPDGRTAEADGGTSLRHGSLYTGQFRFPGGSAGSRTRGGRPRFFHRGGGPLIRGGREDGEEASAALRPPGAGTGSGGPE